MRHALVLAAGVIALALSSVLLTGAPNLTTATGEGNTPILVDDDGATGSGTSMAIGTDGFPVISYSREAPSRDLRVAQCGSVDCSAGNTLTTVDGTGDVGENSSIAIGTDGNPVIAYSSFSDGLKVAQCGNVSCSSGNTITMVDNPAAWVGTYPSLVIGTDGNPIISYRDETNKDLKVAHCGDPACTTGNTLTTLDSAGNVGWYTSIAIGTDGNPIISYLDRGNSDLKVAHCGNVSCTSGNTITTVDDAAGAGWHSSIVIGTDGKPIISYNAFISGDGDLKLLHCGNAGCSSGNSIATVDSAGDTCCSTSLVLDTDGNPVISYRDQIYTDLKVAQCADPTCTSGTVLTEVDGPGFGGLGTSVQIGTDGNPVISYGYLFDRNLLVLHCPDSDCTVKPPTPTPTPTITLTPTVTPTITQTPTITPTPTKQAKPGDTDGDGCPDAHENGPDETLGGQRNYKDPNDYYDVYGPNSSLTLDGVIDLPNDILGVIQHFSPQGQPPYDVRFDRGPQIGANHWERAAPDGVIDLPNDILGVIQQFGHNCV